MLSKKLSSSEHGREISILNFEDFYPSGTPAFTESATLEALWRTGVDPRSLQVITESLLCQYPPNPDIRHSAREKLNAQRKQRIWKVMKAREEILRLEASADSVDGFKKSTRSDKMCSSVNTTSLESRENRPLQSDPEWDQFIRECAKDKSSPQKRTKAAKTIASKEKAKREEKIDALRRIEEQRQQKLEQILEMQQQIVQNAEHMRNERKRHAEAAKKLHVIHSDDARKKREAKEQEERRVYQEQMRKQREEDGIYEAISRKNAMRKERAKVIHLIEHDEAIEKHKERERQSVYWASSLQSHPRAKSTPS